MEKCKLQYYRLFYKQDFRAKLVDQLNASPKTAKVSKR